MKRAACYCRVSTLKQGKEGYSLEWQKANLPILARTAGSVVTDDDVFDEIMSGTKDDRPEYNRLMARIVEGYYQEVWVVEKSRLSRTEDRSEEQRIVEALQKFGCVIRTPSTTFDVTTLEGEFFNDVDSAVNRMERKRIKNRMQNGKVTKLKQGGYIGGNPPTGYKYAGRDSETGKMRFDIDEEQAGMVRLAFELALAGMSGRAIEKRIYEEGYRNSKGNRIYADSILRWLRNPHYAGYTKSHAKKILVDENLFLEPIISREDFEKVQSVLGIRSVTRDKRARHPLSGILTCGNCGRGMKADKVRENRVYTCPSKWLGDPCKGSFPKSIYYDVAHQLVIDFLPHLIDYLQTKVPQKRKKAAQASHAGKLERLTAQKDSLYKKIMSNIRQQEDDYSEIRKHRIIELETQYKLLEEEIEQESKQNSLIQIPSFVGWGQIIEDMEVSDIKDLNTITSMLLSKIYFIKQGHFHSHKFEITRITTAWGDSFRVEGNRKLKFMG